MIDETTKAEIQLRVEVLLRESEIQQNGATPIDAILRARGLTTRTLTSKVASGIQAILGKPLDPTIKGALITDSRLVLTHPDLAPEQKRFTVFHEVGHYDLPWHTRINFFDRNADLTPACRIQLEREANYFAALTQFRCNEFSIHANRMPFGMRSIKKLAQYYETSIESTAIHYVEARNEPCALLGLSIRDDLPEVLAPEKHLLTVAYGKRSNAFPRAIAHFGAAVPRDDFTSRLVIFKTKRIETQEVFIGFDSNSRPLSALADILYTGYRVLVLIHPL